MKQVRLCPVCRRRYHERIVKDNGDLVYVHAQVDLEGRVHTFGCIITDNSTIRGVRFRPRKPPETP